MTQKLDRDCCHSELTCQKNIRVLLLTPGRTKKDTFTADFEGGIYDNDNAITATRDTAVACLISDTKEAFGAGSK